MTETLFRKSCTPAPRDELLIRAAILEGTAGWEAWENWRREADLDEIGDSSIRLFPLVYQRFREQLKGDPVAPIMKGVYRRTWYKNQMLLEQARKVVSALQQESIPSLMLKGIPLTLRYYRDQGVRPMQDVDIAVPFHTVNRAITILQKMGYRYREIRPLEHLREFTHGAEFFSGVMGRIDLHWNIIHELRTSEVDGLFWQSAEPLDLGGVQTLAPDAAYLLAHICLHAAWWAQYPTFKWIPDAIVILNQVPDRILWSSLLHLAQSPRLALPLKDSLGYLQERMSAPVPGRVLDALKKLKVTRKEAAVYEWRLLPYSQRGRKRWLGTLTWLWSYYEQESLFGEVGKEGGLKGWAIRVSGFFRFLMSRYDAKSMPHLAVILLAKFIRRPYVLFR